MARHEMLNNIAHKDLRVITRHGAEFGENIGTVVTFPTEYGDVQREYPIFFRQDPATAEYQSVALLGFQKDENLFLDENGWNASYVPGILARGPFFIGRGQAAGNEDSAPQLTIHVDLDDPRVSQTEGEPVFLPQGGNTRYIERIATILRALNAGIDASKLMFAAYKEYDLIEPLNLEIKAAEEEQINVRGLHTISAERLRNLGGEALEKLNRSGFLQGAYLVVNSLPNVQRLVDLHQKRRIAKAALTSANKATG
jgi:SapC protein